MMTPIVLGIDFGTSATSAGAQIGGRVELIQDGGDPVIPSVVYAPPRGPLEVGRRAQQRLLHDPSSVVRSVKRVLGVPFGSPIVRSFAASAAFRIDGAGDRVGFRLASGACSPEEIVAAVLRRVRELAEARFGSNMRGAIIAAPATASPAYRAALGRAAELARLPLLDLVPASVAGALGLGLGPAARERRLVLCDFGGGTLEVSALIQDGGAFRTVGSAADPALGGDDLDAELAEGLAGMLYRRADLDVRRDPARWCEMLFRCEMAKRQLTAQAVVPFAMRPADLAVGRRKAVEVQLDRAWVEARWHRPLARAATTIEDALRGAGWGPDDVDQVALIGGSSQVPMFRRSVARLLRGRPVLVAPRPEVAVALGAVALAADYAEAGLSAAVAGP